MTQLIPYAILALMLAAAVPGQEPKPLNLLNESRAGLLAAVKNLTPAQWDFKPAPDRWSIHEVVEHIVMVEAYVGGLLDRLPQAPAPAAGFDFHQVDAMILAKMPDRSTKYQAPPAVQPTGRWTPAAALERFETNRARLIAALGDTTELRRHVIAHPAFGPLDGYEWILAAAAHTARHTQQILEVKADPNFPR
ncbi:MAG TPA: DinB family protein [Candidatus Sulfopaludibacter sp.]|nr:DinB family protein [Candidatus Sulfopaludibacter sp.]